MQKKKENNNRWIDKCSSSFNVRDYWFTIRIVDFKSFLKPVSFIFTIMFLLFCSIGKSYWYMWQGVSRQSLCIVVDQHVKSALQIPVDCHWTLHLPLVCFCYTSIAHFFKKKLQSPGTIFLVYLGINQQKYAQKSIRYRNIK